MLQVLALPNEQSRRPTPGNRGLAALLLAIAAASFCADCFTDIPIAGGVLYIPLGVRRTALPQPPLRQYRHRGGACADLDRMFLPHLPSDLAAAFVNRALSMLVVAASGVVAHYQLQLLARLDLEADRAAEVRATKSRFFLRVTRDVRDSVRVILARQETLAQQQPVLDASLDEIAAAGRRAEAAVDNMLDLLGVEGAPSGDGCDRSRSRRAERHPAIRARWPPHASCSSKSTSRRACAPTATAGPCRGR